MRTNKIGKYKISKTLGEGSFAKVKCKKILSLTLYINKLILIFLYIIKILFHL